jgi:hypothetical protein
MSDLRTRLEEYVRRVRQVYEHCRGNEQATKQSLISPLFNILGYDITDPRECLPEHKVDFGKDRSTKPIDWAFSVNSRFAFFVEAKEVGKKLGQYAEQLADYFAKEPTVKLGILTNGIHWRFFTDAEHANIMDRECFAVWDVLNDENPPLEVLTVLQKSQFNPELFRTLAQRERTRNFLIMEINRLLEPSNEFVKLAIANIETRKQTESVIESWKPLLASAIEEWARQRTLNAALNTSPPQPIPMPIPATSKQIITTEDELRAFEIIKTLLGPNRPITYTDQASYFKIHMPEAGTVIRSRRVVCRLYADGKLPVMRITTPINKIESLLAPFPKVTFPAAGWIAITLNSISQIESMGEIMRITYDHQTSNEVADAPDDEGDNSPILKMA